MFISYRGSSELSRMFAEKLYCEINKIPKHKKIFGNVFYSKDYSFGNFKDDISKVMKHVDFFIIPFDKNYLDDFLNAGGSHNNDSITYLEIKQALKNNCCFFIPVSLDGSILDPIHLKSIYKKYDKITCANQPFFINQEQLKHNKKAAIDELVYRVCGELVRLNTDKMSVEIKKQEKNIHMDFCENVNRSNRYVGLAGCRAVTLVNFAGTTFIDGVGIADSYKHHDALNKWFQVNLRNGSIEFRVVLVNPNSNAALDAANYKMNPDGIIISKDKIIEKNLETILQVKKAYPSANIRVYLTDIAIPYAIQKVDFPNYKNDYIKIDLYAPLLSSDGERPTFYLTRRNKKTESMYSFFQRNMKCLIKESGEIKLFNVPDVWVYKRQIIHRANYNYIYPSMSRDAINQCIKHNMPIEVDVIRIKNGEYLVARDAMIEINNYSKLLTECDRTEIADYRSKKMTSEYMFLDELVDVVRGQIPVLIELKCSIDFNQKGVQEKQFVDDFYKIVSQYDNQFEYAIISSNPYILKYMKEIDEKVICGQITLDFSKKEVSQDLIDMHNDNSYMEIFDPDFIACNITDISSKRMVTYCAKHRKPLIGWCAETKEKYILGQCCDNLIVENIENEI